MTHISPVPYGTTTKKCYVKFINNVISIWTGCYGSTAAECTVWQASRQQSKGAVPATSRSEWI